MRRHHRCGMLRMDVCAIMSDMSYDLIDEL